MLLVPEELSLDSIKLNNKFFNLFKKKNFSSTFKVSAQKLSLPFTSIDKNTHGQGWTSMVQQKSTLLMDSGISGYLLKK